MKPSICPAVPIVTPSRTTRTLHRLDVVSEAQSTDCKPRSGWGRWERLPQPQAPAAGPVGAPAQQPGCPAGAASSAPRAAALREGGPAGGAGAHARRSGPFRNYSPRLPAAAGRRAGAQQPRRAGRRRPRTDGRPARRCGSSGPRGRPRKPGAPPPPARPPPRTPRPGPARVPALRTAGLAPPERRRAAQRGPARPDARHGREGGAVRPGGPAPEPPAAAGHRQARIRAGPAPVHGLPAGARVSAGCSPAPPPSASLRLVSPARPPRVSRGGRGAGARRALRGRGRGAPPGMPEGAGRRGVPGTCPAPAPAPGRSRYLAGSPGSPEAGPLEGQAPRDRSPRLAGTPVAGGRKAPGLEAGARFRLPRVGGAARAGLRSLMGRKERGEAVSRVLRGTWALGSRQWLTAAPTLGVREDAGERSSLVLLPRRAGLAGRARRWPPSSPARGLVFGGGGRSLWSWASGLWAGTVPRSPSPWGACSSWVGTHCLGACGAGLRITSPAGELANFIGRKAEVVKGPRTSGRPCLFLTNLLSPPQSGPCFFISPSGWKGQGMDPGFSSAGFHALPGPDARVAGRRCGRCRGLLCGMMETVSCPQGWGEGPSLLDNAAELARQRHVPARNEASVRAYIV